MASSKLSALTAITSVGADDLVYVADTSDGGSSYSSKKVTKANFLSEYITTAAANVIAAANESHIDNLATLTGVAKDSTGLGTFTGSTISDASTIKAALQTWRLASKLLKPARQLPIGPRLQLTVLMPHGTSLLWQMIMHLLLLKVCSPTLALRITRQAIP